jgi:hypothetical protein
MDRAKNTVLLLQCNSCFRILGWPRHRYWAITYQQPLFAEPLLSNVFCTYRTYRSLFCGRCLATGLHANAISMESKNSTTCISLQHILATEKNHEELIHGNLTSNTTQECYLLLRDLRSHVFQVLCHLMQRYCKRFSLFKREDKLL